MAKNLFNSIKLTRPRKNVFDLSHDVKLTLDMGYLVPTLALDCVPGDSFTIGCESLLRFLPIISPVMHRMDVTMHYFFVPNRILWDDWEKWITGDAVDAVIWPYFEYNAADYPNKPILDYMGLPPLDELTPNQQVNALPFAAYQCIFNEYYRDQDLQAEIPYKVNSGNNTTNSKLTEIRRRSWQHDYFTAARPFAQKGPAVDIPIGSLTGQFPVKIDEEPTLPGGVGQWTADEGGSAHTVQAPFEPYSGAPTGDLYTDIQSGEVGSTTINDLRRAFRLQEWLEKNARAGTRYIENILAHFGVKSSDARLNRPEYITGVKSPVQISEVLNTTGEIAEGGLPQGNMAGHAYSFTSGRYGKYFCEEHGWIIGIMSVMPLPAYSQGIHRSMLKSDRFDYYWPEFANIGEQEVLNKEIYVNSSAPTDPFGYVPRYAEYKYMPSRIAGNFRNSLDFWTLARKFENEPALNSDFIECDPGKRIFAVELADQNSLVAQVLHRIKAVRPMPKFGTPTF